MIEALIKTQCQIHQSSLCVSKAAGPQAQTSETYNSAFLPVFVVAD